MRTEPQKKIGPGEGKRAGCKKKLGQARETCGGNRKKIGPGEGDGRRGRGHRSRDGNPFFRGSQGGASRRWEGRKRPAWPAELGGHRTRRPLPRPGRSGDVLARSVEVLIARPLARVYIRQRPTYGLRIRASAINPRVSAAYACHVAGLSRPRASIVLNRRPGPRRDRNQLDAGDQRPAILAGDLLDDLVAVALGHQFRQEPAPVLRAHENLAATV